MKMITTIAQREMNALFSTPMGWFALFSFVLLSGLVFSILITNAIEISLFGPALDVHQVILPNFFGILILFLLFLSPAVGMGIFSQDLQQKRFSWLLGTPISSWELVLGKWLGLSGFMSILILSSTHCMGLLSWFADPKWEFIVLNYMTLWLCSQGFISIAMLCSAQSANSLISLASSFAILFILWFMGPLGDPFGNAFSQFIYYASPLPRVEHLLDGWVMFYDVIYFVLLTMLSIFWTVHRIERYRWQ